MDVNSQDDCGEHPEVPHLPHGVSKVSFLNPTLHLLARKSPTVPDDACTEEPDHHYQPVQCHQPTSSPVPSTNSASTTSTIEVDEEKQNARLQESQFLRGKSDIVTTEKPVGHNILGGSSCSEREILSSAGSSTGSLSSDGPEDGENNEHTLEDRLIHSCIPPQGHEVTPRDLTRVHSSAPELRTLSPPLPLLERKAARPSEKPLDFRGKVPNQPTSLYRSEVNSPELNNKQRSAQSCTRECLMRSLSRALSDNNGKGSTRAACESPQQKSNSQEEPSEGLMVYDIMNHHLGPTEGSDALTFNSRFESGNLRKACKVAPRKRCSGPQNGSSLRKHPVMQVDQEYNLWSSNDIHTRGNTQWFYFSAGECEDKRNKPGTSRKKLVVRKGLRVRFNIVNMRKSDSLCNFGMRPVVLSMNDLAKDRRGWVHEGDDVCYYRSYCGKSSGKKGGRSLYSLSFVYTFHSDGDRVYFAYNFPYTFTRLQRFIRSIEENPIKQKFFRRRLLCRTLSGNACDVLTVTAPMRNNDELARRRIVVVSARVHPGETVASWMMHGLINFITGNSDTAKQLRKRLIFKLVPMLNPDGVINGNYRCSLAGIDLNRRWDRPSRMWHPTIWHTKQMIKQLNVGPSRRVIAYIDLHGHSRKKNVFVYGCDPTRTQRKTLLPRSISAIYGNKHESKRQTGKSQGSGANDCSSSGDVNLKHSQQLVIDKVNDELDHTVVLRTHAQLFTYILAHTSCQSTDSGISVSFKDSNFSVRKSKKATARVVVWNECEVMNSITIEASFCGGGNNRSDKKIKRDIVRSWKGVDSSGAGPVSEDNAMKTDCDDANLTHYAMADLEAIGEIICRAIDTYTKEDSSLQMAPQSTALQPYREGSYAAKLAAVVRAVEIRKRLIADKKNKHSNETLSSNPAESLDLPLKNQLRTNPEFDDLDDFIFNDDDDEEDGDGSDSNPSADEMEEEDLKASSTFTHIISRVQKAMRKEKKNKNGSANTKAIYYRRKSKSSKSTKKKRSGSRKSGTPQSKTRQKKATDKTTGAPSKDGQKDRVLYDLNMAHMIKRSEKHRKVQHQNPNQLQLQQRQAQTIHLQLQHSATRRGQRSKFSDRMQDGNGSSFQGLCSKSFSASRVGPKRGGLNLFTKGKEIDELRSRERQYWLMRRHGKGIQQATGSFSHSLLKRNERHGMVQVGSDGEFSKPMHGKKDAIPFSSDIAGADRVTLMSAPASTDVDVISNTRTSSLGAKMLMEGLNNSSTYTYFMGDNKVKRSRNSQQMGVNYGSIETGGAFFLANPSTNDNSADKTSSPAHAASLHHAFANHNQYSSGSTTNGAHESREGAANYTERDATKKSMASEHTGRFEGHSSRSQGKLPPPVSLGFPGSSKLLHTDSLASSNNMHQSAPANIHVNSHRVHRRSAAGSLDKTLVQVDQKHQHITDHGGRASRERRSNSIDEISSMKDNGTNTGNTSHHYRTSTNIGRIITGAKNPSSIVMQGSRVKAIRQTNFMKKHKIQFGRSPFQRQTLVGTSIHKWPSITGGTRRNGGQPRQVRKNGIRR